MGWLAVITEWLSLLLMLAGTLTCIVSGIGVLRLPDFYTRLHASGITDTLGAGLVFVGLALHFGFSLATLKVALVLFFLLFTSPTATHALAKAARHNGLAPWLREARSKAGKP